MLELMVGLAVAAILLMIGMPSFTSSVEQNQAVSGANALLTALSLARSEAITRGATVTLCASKSGVACDSSRWADGYCLFTGGSDCDASGATVIKADVPLSTSSDYSATGTLARRVSFNGAGSAGAGTFTVTPNKLSSAQAALIRCVVVFQSGRLYLKKPDPTTFTCT